MTLRHVSVRIDTATIERLDQLAERVRRPGREPTRTDAILMALQAGLDVLERQPDDGQENRPATSK